MLPIQLGFIKLFPTDWKRLEGFVILKAGVVLTLKCLRLCIHNQQDFLTNQKFTKNIILNSGEICRKICHFRVCTSRRFLYLEYYALSTFCRKMPPQTRRVQYLEQCSYKLECPNTDQVKSMSPTPHRNLHRGVTSVCLTQMIQKTLVEFRLSTRELLDCPTSVGRVLATRGRRQSLAVPDENQIPPGHSELHNLYVTQIAEDYL